MLQAILTDVGKIEVKRVASVQSLGPREVRVAVEACGLCGSDVHIFLGNHPVLTPPLVMGHEFVGRVTEIGDRVRELNPGMRVVAIAGQGCGQCEECVAGQFNRCEQLKVIGGHIPGGLSEEVVLDEQQLVAVPPSMSGYDAALVEVAAVALHTIRRVDTVRGKDCLVLGCGPVGLLLIRLLKCFGAASIIATDVNPTRLVLAARSGSRSVDVSSHEHEQLRDGAFDVAFDCAGREDTLQLALRLVRRGGTVALTAVFPPECRISMVQLQRGERKLVGVQMYQRDDFDTIIRLVESGELSLAGLVTQMFPLVDVAKAFELLLSSNPAAGKVLIVTNHDTEEAIS